MKTSVIIPAYNEEDRLPRTLTALAQAIRTDAATPLAIAEVLVVDDGSSDRTVSVASSFAGELPSLAVVKNGRNYGKGYSVRRGMREAHQPWLLVADADGATPWTEASKLGSCCASENGPAIAIGSRDTEGSEILLHQSRWREFLGQSFNVAVRVLTPLPFRDTQCGFKLVHKDAARRVLHKLSVDRFAWDVELLLAANDLGIPTFEVPVVWEHQEGSRIHVLRDGVEMGVTLMKILLRRQLGFLRRRQADNPHLARPSDPGR